MIKTEGWSKIEQEHTIKRKTRIIIAMQDKNRSREVRHRARCEVKTKQDKTNISN